MVGQSLSARHAVVALEGVKVRFPIYQSGSRSLKKNLISRGSAGRFARDANDRLTIEALRDISLTVEEGDRLALIGANGAGKTTLLRVMAGGYENIRMRALLLGLPTRIIIDRLQDIADFTELGDYLEMPMRTYSSGMMLRLAFAVATCFEPEVLLMDEWILAGDARSGGSTRSWAMRTSWCWLPIIWKSAGAGATGARGWIGGPAGNRADRRGHRAVCGASTSVTSDAQKPMAH
jgi:ABC-2 type transport system ATP-binding protein/lipopolysaccharide transport system ATP-binding protein